MLEAKPTRLLAGGGKAQPASPPLMPEATWRDVLRPGQPNLLVRSLLAIVGKRIAAQFIAWPQRAARIKVAGDVIAFHHPVLELFVVHSIWMKTSLGNSWRKQILPRHTPEHLGMRPSRNPSRKERCCGAIDGTIAAASDLMKRAECQAASKQMTVKVANTKGQYRPGFYDRRSKLVGTGPSVLGQARSCARPKDTVGGAETYRN